MEKNSMIENSKTEQLTSYDYNEINKQKEKALLERVCRESDINLKTVLRLINLEMSMIGKRKRRGLQNQIDTIIQSAIMSKEGEVKNVIKEGGI